MSLFSKIRGDIVLVLKDISLVSANKRKIPRNRKAFLRDNPVYQEAKTALAKTFKRYKKRVSLKGDVSVKIFVSTLKDIDNIVKIIHDALQDAKVFENDRQIKMFQVMKVSGRKEHLIVAVSQAPKVVTWMRRLFAEVFG